MAVIMQVVFLSCVTFRRAYSLTKHGLALNVCCKLGECAHMGYVSLAFHSVVDNRAIISSSMLLLVACYIRGAQFEGVQLLFVWCCAWPLHAGSVFQSLKNTLVPVQGTYSLNLTHVS